MVPSAPLQVVGTVPPLEELVLVDEELLDELLVPPPQ